MLINIKLCYKRTVYKGGYLLVALTCLIKACQYKDITVYRWMGLLTSIKPCYVDIQLDMVSWLLVCYSLWGSNKNGVGFDNWFHTKYLWLWLLHRCLLWSNYASLYSSMLSTWCVRTTVCSIRYFNWQKVRLLFVWWLML